MERHEPTVERRADARTAARARPARGAQPGGAAGELLSLQRLAGNAAVSGALEAGTGLETEVAALAVQRQPHGDAGVANATAAAAAGAGSAAGHAPPPRPPSQVLDLATSQRILTAEYGTVHAILPGSIHIEPDQAALFADYDRVCIAGGVVNPGTRRPWAVGDAARYDPHMDGFQWGNDVYIDGSRAGSIVTPHEMLHMNTAADWRAFVGDRINEGVTENLAIDAMTRARAAISGLGYADERRVATALVAAAGRDVVVRAYFNGGPALATMATAVDGACGAGTWAAAKTAAEARNWDEAVRRLSARVAGAAAAAAAVGAAAAGTGAGARGAGAAAGRVGAGSGH